jgi:hypothetical protein
VKGYEKENLANKFREKRHTCMQLSSFPFQAPGHKMGSIYPFRPVTLIVLINVKDIYIYIYIWIYRKAVSKCRSVLLHDTQVRTSAAAILFCPCTAQNDAEHKRFCDHTNMISRGR